MNVYPLLARPLQPVFERLCARFSEVSSMWRQVHTDFVVIVLVLSASSTLAQSQLWKDARLSRLELKYNSLKKADPARLEEFISAWKRKCASKFRMESPCSLRESDVYPGGRQNHVLLFRGSVADWTAGTSSLLRLALRDRALCDESCTNEIVAEKAVALASEVTSRVNIDDDSEALFYSIREKRWYKIDWSVQGPEFRARGPVTQTLFPIKANSAIRAAANPIWLLAWNHAAGAFPMWKISLLAESGLVGLDAFVSFSENPEIARVFLPSRASGSRSLWVLSVPVSQIPQPLLRSSTKRTFTPGEFVRPDGPNPNEGEVDAAFVVDETLLKEVLLL